MNQLERGSNRGHTRNKSSITRSTRPRSSTKGPLDADDDPLTSASPLATPSAPLSPNARSSQHRAGTSPGPRSAAASPRPGEARPKNFSFLLRPEIYHPLTPLNVPLAFRNSSKQPSPEAPLEELLAKGHFRAAAVAAVQELTGFGASGAVDPKDADRIFSLLYIRLACLTLIDATPLAAQEVKALEDLNNSRTYVDEATGKHLVPWDLRILNIRLQALGFNDQRRAVMSYHELAREARDGISSAKSENDGLSLEMWKKRLQDLGIQVASALIGMGDLSGAAHHLNSLRSIDDGKLALSKGLLWLHLGDAEQARASVNQLSVESKHLGQIVLALSDMADADHEKALERWSKLQEEMEDEMVGVNMAVCLIYLGRMKEGREVLEKLVEFGQSSHTLLFNLSTIYELCTDKNRNLKVKLAEKVAGMDESFFGWEKTNADFKL